MKKQIALSMMTLALTLLVQPALACSPVPIGMSIGSIQAVTKAIASERAYSFSTIQIIEKQADGSYLVKLTSDNDGTESTQRYTIQWVGGEGVRCPSPVATLSN